METFEVEAHEELLRVDKFLATRFVPNFSRTYFAHLIEEGLVLVNGEPVRKRERLAKGDQIEVCFSDRPDADLTPEDIPLDILYEDKDIIVVNKPVGMVVHPAPGNWSGTFVNGLLYHCFEVREIGDRVRPGIVHRLDKDTSGVLIAAKHLESQKRLIESFANRKVHKEYLAITAGVPREGRCETLIGRDHKIRQKMAVVEEGGKIAITDVRILKKGKELAFIHLTIETGRTHQIRVHLKHLKAPVLGDSVYGHSGSNKRHNALRPYLHAWKLKLPHPMTGEEMEFEAPIPTDILSVKI